MKLASLFFFAMLVYAHRVCGFYEPLEQPLCAFREGALGSLGYALFFAIALIGVLYALDLKRYGQPGEAANTASIGVLLLIVAATPSRWALHNASAVVLLASLIGYFALLLYRSGRPLMLVHLSVPILLAVVTGFQSYGIWQKALICYLVVAAAVHHHVVKRGARVNPVVAPDGFLKERKAYHIHSGSTSARARANPRASLN